MTTPSGNSGSRDGGVDPASVSVVIATYRRPDVLRTCLEHIMEQSTPPGEVLVVDASPDEKSEASSPVPSYVMHATTKAWARFHDRARSASPRPKATSSPSSTTMLSPTRTGWSSWPIAMRLAWAASAARHATTSREKTPKALARSVASSRTETSPGSLRLTPEKSSTSTTSSAATCRFGASPSRSAVASLPGPRGCRRYVRTSSSRSGSETLVGGWSSIPVPGCVTSGHPKREDGDST